MTDEDYPSLPFTTVAVDVRQLQCKTKTTYASKLKPAALPDDFPPLTTLPNIQPPTFDQSYAQATKKHLIPNQTKPCPPKQRPTITKLSLSIEQTQPKHVPKTKPKPNQTKPKQIKTEIIPKATSNEIRLPKQIEPITEGGGDYVEDSSFSEGSRFSNFDSFKQSFDIWCKKHYHPMKIRNSKKNDDVNCQDQGLFN